MAGRKGARCIRYHSLVIVRMGWDFFVSLVRNLLFAGELTKCNFSFLQSKSRWDNSIQSSRASAASTSIVIIVVGDFL